MRNYRSIEAKSFVPAQDDEWSRRFDRDIGLTLGCDRQALTR